MTQYYFNQEVFVRVTNKVGVWREFQLTASPSYTEIRFRVPFSDTAERDIAEIQLYNLSEESKKHLAKGNELQIRAGYKESTTVEIFRGEILSVSPEQEDGNDAVVRITAAEGIDYFAKDPNSKAADGMTFGVNSCASSALQQIAQNTGIDLQIKHLKVDYVFRAGYNANGEPRRIIEDIAKLCESAVYYDRGKLVINDVKSSNPTPIVLQAGSGLLSAPKYVERDGYKAWELETVMLNNCFVGSMVQLKHRIASGAFHVKSGEHSFDGNRFTTRLEVY